MLSELAGRLLAAGQILLGLPLLEQAAAREGTALRDVRLAIDHLCRGEARARASGETTFAEFAERVISGKLAEQYPDHVKAIRRPDLYRGTSTGRWVPLAFATGNRLPAESRELTRTLREVWTTGA
ncbi:hypothetical protein [Sorangium sp. So ce1182]|uniref:hypothetical protein n=1 Tax=Sorangium sp. So ce1182 TaxID=3133334 RepID=UPI003F61BF4D